MTKACEEALLKGIGPEVRPKVEEALAAKSLEEAKKLFDARLADYAEAELARPCDDFLTNHEFGGHLRPLFALHRRKHDGAFLDRCMELFRARRQWVTQNRYHGYGDCEEVHHEPETFSFFQIPLLNATGDSEVLSAIEDVAEHMGNWVQGTPDWYDWQEHGFRSTWMGTREVKAHHPFDYQEADHWQLISMALAVYRHGAGQRYLDLALDYANRWAKHIEQCTEGGRPIPMQILPDGAVAEEMGYAGRIAESPPPGHYQVFYFRVAPNTTHNVVKGLQDVFRLTGEARLLDAAGLALSQCREHRDRQSGRWAFLLRRDRWMTQDERFREGLDALVAWSGGVVRGVLRQLALRPDPELRRDLVAWAEAVLVGDDPVDVGMVPLLFGAFTLTRREEFLAEGYRCLCAGMAATYPETRYHCSNPTTRVGYGSSIETALSCDQGLAPDSAYGSWDLRLAE